MEKVIERKNKLIEDLESVIDIENFASGCFRHLASLIRNGRIRSKFNLFADTAEANKDSLIEHLGKLGVADFRLEEKCTYCRIKPESFSLTGVLNLGAELTKAAIKHYSILAHLSNNEDESRLFKKNIKEKTRQRTFLIKERRYHQTKESAAEIIRDFCMPLIKSMF